MTTNFPKMYNTEEAAALLNLAGPTLQKFRLDMTGPNWVKLGNSVRYLEEDLLDWIKGQRQLPVTNKAATPEQLNVVMTEGHTERKAAMAERKAEHAAMDNPVDDGFTDFMRPAGMTTHFNVPPVILNEDDSSTVEEVVPSWLAKHQKAGA